jgi:hypothetical protein
MGATALSRKSQVGVVQHNKSQNLLPVLAAFALKEGPDRTFTLAAQILSRRKT